MGRETLLDETIRQLESRVGLALDRIRELKAEEERLQKRVARLERRQAEVLERINVVLDRMETTG